MWLPAYVLVQVWVCAFGCCFVSANGLLVDVCQCCCLLTFVCLTLSRHFPCCKTWWIKNLNLNHACACHKNVLLTSYLLLLGGTYTETSFLSRVWPVLYLNTLRLYLVRTYILFVSSSFGCTICRKQRWLCRLTLCCWYLENKYQVRVTVGDSVVLVLHISSAD